MRNLIILLILSFSLPSFAQFNNPIIEIEAMELIATYSLKWQEDSLNSDFIRQEDMLLFIGKNISKFTSENSYILDTIFRKLSSWNEFNALTSDRNNQLPHSAFRYKILKNYPKSKITCMEHSLDGTFKYEENLELVNWQLVGDTATIAGYKAQKAICIFGGRKWEAWFSPELPFNDGPYKFNGLPGLIVKIFDTQMHYEFELISIKKPRNKLMIDYEEKSYIEATKFEFFRAEDDFRADIVNRVKEKGASNNVQQAAARNIKKRNNPIELKRK